MRYLLCFIACCCYFGCVIAQDVTYPVTGGDSFGGTPPVVPDKSFEFLDDTNFTFVDSSDFEFLEE